MRRNEAGTALPPDHTCGSILPLASAATACAYTALPNHYRLEELKSMTPVIIAVDLSLKKGVFK